MFFWKKNFYPIHINSFKASLQSCHKTYNPNKCDIRNNPKRIDKKISKRTFSFAPSEFRASMCLEASFSFSFFFLFMINIFSIIFLFMTYTQDLTMLQKQGKKVAAYSYGVKEIAENTDDIIRLEKQRHVNAPFILLSFSPCRIYTRCVIKPWTGYDVTGKFTRQEEETLVYMTEYGEVCHRSRSCGYLSLSIQAVAFSSVEEERNQEGERYFPCESCKSNDFVTVVFVTSYGNKYHMTSKCRNLKRTIKTIPLSQVEGINFCKKCG